MFVSDKNWTRRDIIVEEGDCRVKVKLWNEHSEASVSAGDCVVIENVEIDIFENQVALTSTPSTKIQVGIIDKHQQYVQLLQRKNCKGRVD